MNGLAINLKPLVATIEQFYEIVHLNPDMRLERTAEGEIIIMPPAGLESSARNADLTVQFHVWNQDAQQGIVFDSSAGFTLPNSAIRSPDVSWVSMEKWQQLTPEERQRFASIVPDFVVELLSPSDRIADTRAKMREFISNGVRLGWLIDPKERRVEVYRPNQSVQVLNNPASIRGDPELPGFTLDLRRLFDLF